MVVKKLKTADGTPADANLFEGEGDTTVDIADDLIRQHDTVLVPIAQFEFSEADTSHGVTTCSDSSSSSPVVVVIGMNYE